MYMTCDCSNNEISVHMSTTKCSLIFLQVEFSRSGHSPQLRALSYFLILFPSLDVSSAYPLVVHTIMNNIYSVFMGQDTTKKPKYKFDWLIRVILKFFIATLPIVAALFVSNLVYVLKYAGLFGFGMCFFFPTLLQLQSQRVCRKLFGSTPGTIKVKPEDSTTSSDSNSSERVPLLSVQEGPDDLLYMTPFSSRILSHPVSVMILGGVGLLLFILAIVGLAVHPSEG